MSPHAWPITDGNPAAGASQNRKRRSDERNGPFDTKKQRFLSPQSVSTSNHAVPFRSDRRYSMPGSSRSLHHPLLQTPDVGCVPSLRDFPFMDYLKTSLPLARDKLSQQILDIFQACQQQVSDLEKKELCRAELQREIQRVYPGSRLFLVGSSMNGFGTRSSDADLCLVITNEPVDQRTEARHILNIVQQLFFRLSYIERPQLIRAKVPIVKFRDKVSLVEYDLNVNNIVGIRNTFLLRSYAFIEIRIRPLVLVVKKWASHHGINDASRGTLSSYSLVLMVLHYLQTLPEPVIPSLQKLYPDCFDPSVHLHRVHLGSLQIPPYLSKNTSTIGDLFLGFLKYYATDYNWDTLMISIREAKAMQRPSDNEWKDKFICIEEPFDRTNTARAVHEKIKFDTIKEEFQKSYEKIRNNKDLNVILPVRSAIQRR
ncbi:poly(A) RNA polymerase GLD2 isoform X2 [Protopterus annectens]|nr:poly(A) RNA polymerase GLD2 isoform X2 [Protopterus annectens]XP_043919650.1 poly(A) RNA polymerase GLD2 isoform X2 [Protopterus annectens]